MAQDRTRSCYKLPRQITGNLNIAYDSANSNIALWSKYQILIYEKGDFSQNPIEILLPFVAEKVLFHHNYLLCMDCTGNLNIKKILQTPVEVQSIPFSICKQNIIACELINTEYVASLQLKGNMLKFFVNEFNLIFDYQNKFEVDFVDRISDEVRGKYIMVSETVNPEYVVQLKDVFDIKNCNLKYSLLVFTLDKINVYTCLISNMMNKVQNEKLKLIKASRTYIVDIKISITTEVYILLGLAGGHIMKIRLANVNSKPEVYHLNTPLYKFIVIENNFIYTDGLSMWKSENLLSTSESLIDQFFVRNVKDFIIKQKKIICVTFSNLVYTFFLDSNSSYINSNDSDPSCSVEAITNSDCLKKIIGTVKKNEEIIKQINKESEYLTALSLSNRQDIMDNIIQLNAKVYDNYMDVTQENTDLILTDALNDYYDTKSYYFLLTLNVATIQHKLNKLLSNVLGDIKIHITLFRRKALKTTTIQVAEQLKKKNFVISLKRDLLKPVSGVQVLVKIITNVPGQLDGNEKQWIVLYRKCLDIDSVHFIKTEPFSNTTCLKRFEDSLDNLINKRAEHLYGAFYEFSDTKKEEKSQIIFYLKLPHNYESFLSNKLNYKEYLDSIKSNMLIQNCFKKFSSTNNKTELLVGDEKVVLVRDQDDRTLKISCSDIKIAFDLRNLLAQIILPAYKECRSGNEFVNLKLYTDIENLKRDIKNHRNSEELMRLFSDFQSLVYGSLPI